MAQANLKNQNTDSSYPHNLIQSDASSHLQRQRGSYEDDFREHRYHAGAQPNIEDLTPQSSNSMYITQSPSNRSGSSSGQPSTSDETGTSVEAGAPSYTSAQDGMETLTRAAADAQQSTLKKSIP